MLGFFTVCVQLIVFAVWLACCVVTVGKFISEEPDKMDYLGGLCVVTIVVWFLLWLFN